MLENINIYVLTLKNSKRYESIKTYMNSFNIKYTKVIGINGKDINSRQYIEISNFCNNFCPHGVIGCGLSHMKIWEIISQNENSINLIIEDDTYVDFNKLDELINQLSECALYDTTGFIQLDGTVFIKKNRIALNPSKNNNQYYLDNYRLHLTTGAYIISGKSAKKFLKIKINYHIDVMMNTIHNVKNYIVYPTIADQKGQDTSTMDVKNKKFLNILEPNTYYVMTVPWIKIPILNIIINFFMFLIILLIIVCIFTKIDPIIWLLIGILFVEAINFDFK